MKKFILFILFLFTCSTLFFSNSYSQWIKQNWPYNNSIGTCFFDLNIGLVAGKSFTGSLYKLYKTTDGGFNWSVNYSPKGWIYSIQKIDDSTLYMRGDNSSSYLLYKTTNRGITWDSLNYASLDGMYFISKDTGWVSMHDGNYARYYLTTNGGVSFTLLYSHAISAAYETIMYFLKEKYNNNFIGYRSIYSEVKKTTDGGYNWIDLPVLPIVPQYDKKGKLLTQPDITQITFINKDTGWVANGSKSIFKTTNGGLNWIVQTMPLDNHLVFNSYYYFEIINKDTIFSDIGRFDFGNGVYRGVVFKTTNSGLNWGYQLPDTSYRIVYFSRPFFLNSKTGWLTNIHTTNGGGPIIYTEIKNIIEEHPERYNLYQNYPNPFNPTTTIDFYLPKSSEVCLRIIDVTGRLIYKIIEGFHLAQGYHSYRIDGFSMLGLSSGVYFYKLTSSDKSGSTTFQETKQMIYIK
jgi:hypothetical protein